MTEINRKTRELSVTALAAAIGLVSGQSHAADFIVDTTATDDVVDDKMSLHEAIAAANGNGAGLDTITFAPGVTGTIDISYLPTITSDLNIQGPGAAKLTLDANNAQGLRMEDQQNAYYAGGDYARDMNVTLSGLTITNARTSGIQAVLGSYYFGTGSLSLDDVSVTGNTSDSPGGGVWAKYSHTHIVNSTISNNEADIGGGISVGDSGSLSIMNSVISGNTANAAGAIAANLNSEGGGVFLDGAKGAATKAAYGIGDGAVSIINSQITSNSAPNLSGGLAVMEANDVELFDTIIRDNVGGKYAAGGVFTNNVADVSLDDVTLDKNRGFLAGGAMLKYNGFGWFRISGTTITNNAGVEHGDPEVPVPNLVGGLFVGGGDVRVDIYSSEVSGNSGSVGGVMISEAKYADIEASTIRNNTAFKYGGGIALAGVTASIEQSTITGNKVTGLQPPEEGPEPEDTAAAKFEPAPRSPEGGDGGGVFATNGADLMLMSSVLTGNTAGRDGGAVAVAGGYSESGNSFYSEGNLFQSNSAARDGGAVAASEAAVGMWGNVFTGNQAGRDGGAVMVEHAKYGEFGVGVFESVFDSNRAAHGGAIAAMESNEGLIVEASTFKANQATGAEGPGFGGAIATYYLRGETEIINSTFVGNKAHVGSAVAHSSASGSDLHLVHATVMDNPVLTHAETTPVQKVQVHTEVFDSLTQPRLVNSVISGTPAAVGVSTAIYAYAELYVNNSLLNQAPVTEGNAFVYSETSDALIGQNPMLATLTNNGGLTDTMHPKAGSPLIDAGGEPLSVASPLHDQRGNGFNRVMNTAADIGAVEVQDETGDGVADDLPPKFSAGLAGALGGPVGKQVNVDLNDFVKDPENTALQFWVEGLPTGLWFAGDLRAATKAGEPDTTNSTIKGELEVEGQFFVTVRAEDNDGDGLVTTEQFKVVVGAQPATLDPVLVATFIEDEEDKEDEKDRFLGSTGFAWLGVLAFIGMMRRRKH